MTAARASLAAVALLLSPMPGAAQRPPADDDFARGLAALLRDDSFTDPRAIRARLGLALRNPEKWTHQPEGTYRTAGWELPPNRWGLATLALLDIWSEPAADYSAMMELALTGWPCLSVAALERATGARAAFGGIAVAMVMDAPPPPPQRLGNEHATILVRNRHGREASISTLSSRPGRAGCIRSLAIESIRPRP